MAWSATSSLGSAARSLVPGFFAPLARVRRSAVWPAPSSWRSSAPWFSSSSFGSFDEQHDDAHTAAVSTFHDRPAFPRGFRCASRNCGLKPTAKDLALFVSDVDAAAAAVFTRNHFPGAPVVLGRETIRGGQLRAIVVNSKVSNVATGERGLEHARRMARAAAAEVGTTPDRVLVSSTGVIGVPLPIEKIEHGVRGMSAELQSDPLVGAEGIM